jgi:cell shape-determining protein MreD
MSIVLIFISGLVLFILQTSTFQTLSYWTAMLNPLFVLFVFIAIRLNQVSGIILTLLFAVLLDIFSGLFTGLYPVVYLTLYFHLRWFNKIIVIKENPQKIALVLISFLFVSFTGYIFVTLLIPDNTPSWSWFDILIQIAFLALITTPLFNFFEMLIGQLNVPGKAHSWGTWNKTNRFRD